MFGGASRMLFHNCTVNISMQQWWMSDSV
jgi:hypothetical protein